MPHLDNRLPDTHEGARERLASTLGHLVDEGQHLLDQAQRSGGEHLGVAREKFEAQLARARNELESLGAAADYRARRAARAGNRALHEHPYAAIGIAAGLGALLAAVFARRR